MTSEVTAVAVRRDGEQPDASLQTVEIRTRLGYVKRRVREGPTKNLELLASVVNGALTIT